MKYKTLAKICLAISGFSIVYMFLIVHEGTYLGWIVFFVFLVFAILFGVLGEKEDEIVALHSLKEVKQTRQEKKEINSHSSDPFYISDKFNPNYQKLMDEKLKEKETNSSKIEESEIIFIPTLHPGMKEQWGVSPKKNSETVQESPVDK